MLDWYSAMLLARSWHEEIGRNLERRCLEREAIGARPRRLRVPGNSMLTLGCWLVEQGWRLHSKQDENGADTFEWGRLEIRARHSG